MRQSNSNIGIISVRGDNRMRGQVLVIGVFVILGLAMASITVANVGMMVAEKIRLQDSVDAAAYSAAVAEARYMNLSAYINRGVVANYNAMAFNTALWAVTDSYDHGTAVVTTALYTLSTIAKFIPLANLAQPAIQRLAVATHNYVHDPLHDFNRTLKSMFSQEGGDADLNQYLEMLNTHFYSVYQGALYAAMQSSRYQIAQRVAKEVDPEVITTTVLGLGAEHVSSQELANAVDYVIENPNELSNPFNQLAETFDRTFGVDTDLADDHPVLLGAVVESSLDKFVAGYDRDGTVNSLRNLNTGNLMPYASTIESILHLRCVLDVLDCLFDSSSCCQYRFRFSLGSQMIDSDEDWVGEGHVPIIAQKRMREVQFFGLNTDFRVGLPLEWFGWLSDFTRTSLGYSSGWKTTDIHNVSNIYDGREYDFGRMVESTYRGRKHNFLNYLIGSSLFGLVPPFGDCYWDGNTSQKPVDVTNSEPPNPTISVRYLMALRHDGRSKGVPAYDWKTDLNNVGFPLYHYDSRNADVRGIGNTHAADPDEPGVFAGPSIAVLGVKYQKDINGLQGLGIGNPYDMTAMSRAQVYYLHSPNRPDEKPSLFNPYWVARLAPIDSDATPLLLRKGLPFLSSTGIPITPTR